MFKVLSMPTTNPPPTEKKAYTVIVDVEGYKPVTLTGFLDPE
jgi:hypothetical protein